MKFGTNNSEAAFLKEQYGLDLGALSTDAISTLHDLAEGGRTAKDVMMGLHQMLVDERAATAARILAVRNA